MVPGKYHATLTLYLVPYTRHYKYDTAKIVRSSCGVSRIIIILVCCCVPSIVFFVLPRRANKMRKAYICYVCGRTTCGVYCLLHREVCMIQCMYAITTAGGDGAVDVLTLTHHHDNLR